MHKTNPIKSKTNRRCRTCIAIEEEDVGEMKYEIVVSAGSQRQAVTVESRPGAAEGRTCGSIEEVVAPEALREDVAEVLMVYSGTGMAVVVAGCSIVCFVFSMSSCLQLLVSLSPLFCKASKVRTLSKQCVEL